MKKIKFEMKFYFKYFIILYFFPLKVTNFRDLHFIANLKILIRKLVMISFCVFVCLGRFEPYTKGGGVEPPHPLV